MFLLICGHKYADTNMRVQVWALTEAGRKCGNHMLDSHIVAGIKL